jgi:hypothetical protein
MIIGIKNIQIVMTNPKKSKTSSQNTASKGCDCVQDPFASLPPELRPKNRTWKDGLRQVTCPGCGLEYWTNMEIDLCIDCRKKGITIPNAKNPE